MNFFRIYYNPYPITALPTKHSVRSYSDSESAFPNTATFLTPIQYKVPDVFILAIAFLYSATPIVPYSANPLLQHSRTPPWTSSI